MSDGNNTTYRQQLKERIVDIAMHAFAERGIRAVRMDDIARELGISKRTLYEIFENKEELLYAGVAKYRVTKEQTLLEDFAKMSNVIDIVLYSFHTKVDEFKRTSPQFYTDLERYPQVMSMLSKAKNRNRERLMEVLKRGVSEGFFRDDVDFDIVVLLFEAIGIQVMGNHLYERFDIEQLFLNMVFPSVRGICTLRGIEVLDRRLKEEPLGQNLGADRSDKEEQP